MHKDTVLIFYYKESRYEQLLISNLLTFYDNKAPESEFLDQNISITLTEVAVLKGFIDLHLHQ